VQNVSEEFKQAISQPSREIESRITFPDLVLDDYQVRSINLNSLLVGSDDFEIGTAPMDMVKVELVEDTGDEWGRNLVIKTGSLNGYYLDGVWTPSPNARTPKEFIKVVPGGMYTMSVPASEFVNNVVRMSMWDENKDFVVRVNYSGGSQSQPIRIHKIIIPDNVHYITPGYGRDIDIKIEKGSKATDWTPAPEDVDEAISTIDGEVVSLKSRVNTAEQKITDSAIVSTVTNSSEWVILGSYVSDVDIRVSSAESSIIQHADLIASKVSQTDFTGETIVSLIEQTPSQIKLSADKIKLEGLVTANGNFKILTDGSIEARNVIVKDQNNQAIMTSQGLKMKYLFMSSGLFMGWDRIGIVQDIEPMTRPVYLFAYIPNDFIIDSAILHVKSMPFYLTDQPPVSGGGSGAPDGYYHANNLRLYKVTDPTDLCIWVDGYHVHDSPIYGSRSRITTTPWDSNWSPTGNKIQVRSSDIKSHLTIGGRTILMVESNTTPSLANTRYQGYMQMELEIEGYLKG